MLSWSWTPNLFTVFYVFSQRLPWSFQHVGLVCWVGGWAGWMGGRLGGWFLWFVGLGLVGLLHVGIGILWVYGGWNTFDIFFGQYCSMEKVDKTYLLFPWLFNVLVSVGWRSHTLRVTAIYCFWLFQANSLGHIFIIFYLCNVLLLL